MIRLTCLILVCDVIRLGVRSRRSANFTPSADVRRHVFACLATDVNKIPFPLTLPLGTPTLTKSTQKILFEFLVRNRVSLSFLVILFSSSSYFLSFTQQKFYLVLVFPRKLPGLGTQSWMKALLYCCSPKSFGDGKTQLLFGKKRAC